MSSIDDARNQAITRARGGRSFVTAAMAAALSGIKAERFDVLGRMNPFESIGGRLPTRREYVRHLTGGYPSMTCRSDLELIFGPLRRPTPPQKGVKGSLRFDQAERRRVRKRKRRIVSPKKDIFFRAMYIGPEESLQGETALFRLRRGQWLAQFDSLESDFAHGWHEFPRRYFKKLRKPPRQQPWQTVHADG